MFLFDEGAGWCEKAREPQPIMNSLFQASVPTCRGFSMKTSLCRWWRLTVTIVDCARDLFPTGARDLLIVTYCTYLILRGFIVSCWGGGCFWIESHCLSWAFLPVSFSSERLDHWLNILLAFVATRKAMHLWCYTILLKTYITLGCIYSIYVHLQESWFCRLFVLFVFTTCDSLWRLLNNFGQ